jgi:hypothetical protein
MKKKPGSRLKSGLLAFENVDRQVDAGLLQEARFRAATDDVMVTVCFSRLLIPEISKNHFGTGQVLPWAILADFA